MSTDNPFAVTNDSYGDRSGSDRDTSGAEVSLRTLEMLKQTRPWVMFIGVLAWIGTVLMGLASVGMIISGLMGGGNAQLQLVGIGVLYFMFIFVYYYMAKSLTGYAGAISMLSASERMSDLEDALEKQKNFWKTAGITTLVFFVVYAIIIVLAIGGVAMFNM